MCTCRFEGVVPSAHAEKGREAVQELGQQVGPLVDTYVAALEARKLKDGIRIAMAISSVGEFASCIDRKVYGEVRLHHALREKSRVRCLCIMHREKSGGFRL